MKAMEKEIKVEYFNEVADMYEFLRKHPEYKMVKYNFTFSYGYQLQYTKK